MTIQIERPATKKTWKGEEKQGRQQGNILDFPSAGLALFFLCVGRRRDAAWRREGIFVLVV
jgi:hypothetical protein